MTSKSMLYGSVILVVLLITLPTQMLSVTSAAVQKGKEYAVADYEKVLAKL